MSLNYQLIAQPADSAIETVLRNRGIKEEDYAHYLSTTDDDISDYNTLGKTNLLNAAKALCAAINDNQKALVVVDSDCDGMTSSAILINYLHRVFPAWVENNITYFIHEGKQHGLGDCTDYALEFGIVFCPDSASNDYESHKRLKERDITCIVLDHHEAEKISPDAIIINNQLSNYPNKDFSGAGITWQFCRFLDSVLSVNYADDYLDLVALGNCADMMAMTSIETKHIITKGFADNHIKNPFIATIAEKNSYSLGPHLTYMGVAFYIAPYVNAMVRSGTQSEKELLFNSMLEFKAEEKIPSTKRGHLPGATEKLVHQAVRIAFNVKNRQNKAVDAGMALIEQKIVDENLLSDKAILVKLKEGEVDKNIAGLCANKIMSKYQRPCCVLTEKNEELAGSARGYSKSGVESFKAICESSNVTNYCEGHANAFGISIPSNEEIQKKFVKALNEMLANMRTEPVYYVDYIFDGNHANQNDILQIAAFKDLWGQQFDEAMVAIEKVNITPTTLTLMSPNKKPTLKITMPNGIVALKFGSSQEEYETLLRADCMLNIVGKCNANTWLNKTTAQVFIEDYEIIPKTKLTPFDF